MFASPPLGAIDLTAATVEILTDNSGTWADDYRLRGFRYGQIYNMENVELSSRLAWLRRDLGGYSPQLYDQLASAYEAAATDRFLMRTSAMQTTDDESRPPLSSAHTVPSVRRRAPTASCQRSRRRSSYRRASR